MKKVSSLSEPCMIFFLFISVTNFHKLHKIHICNSHNSLQISGKSRNSIHSPSCPALLLISSSFKPLSSLKDPYAPWAPSEDWFRYPFTFQLVQKRLS